MSRGRWKGKWGRKGAIYPSSKHSFRDTKQLRCWVCYSRYDTSEKCL